jgi:hypothetical protein
LVLEVEVTGDLDQLTEAITAETGAASEMQARLSRRLAIAFWKGERAERNEGLGERCTTAVSEAQVQ